MRLNSLNNIIVILIVTCVSCATSPPDLPPDYGSTNSKLSIDASLFSSEDLKKTCDIIDSENEQLISALNSIDKNIEDSRLSDQSLVYLLGPVFSLLGSNNDVEEKRAVIQKRLDNLNLLQRYKKC